MMIPAVTISSWVGLIEGTVFTEKYYAEDLRGWNFYDKFSSFSLYAAHFKLSTMSLYNIIAEV